MYHDALSSASIAATPPPLTTAAPIQIALGSKNAAKRRAVELGFASVYPQRHVHIECFDVESGVLPQPLTAADTLSGATNRSLAAQSAYRQLHSALPDFALGMEGGIEQVGSTHLEGGYIVCRHSSGRVGVGRSASFEVSGVMMARLAGGKEMGDVIDELSGETDVRQREGMMGVITNSVLPRAECYAHGLIFALAPFVSPSVYWNPLPEQNGSESTE